MIRMRCREKVAMLALGWCITSGCASQRRPDLQFPSPYKLAQQSKSNTQSLKGLTSSDASSVAVSKPFQPTAPAVLHAAHTVQVAEPSKLPIAGATTAFQVTVPEFGADSPPTSGTGMTLEDFESLAFANNPTIQALAATTQKAAGFRTQVGLRGNPIVGYQAMQLADQGTDQHTAFIEQEFATGGKLHLNQRVLNEALRAQSLELETQRWRVVTDVRTKFYEALAAQRRIELYTDFQSVTDKGLELAELRMKALEGSMVEVLQARIQKSEIDLARQQAKIEFDASWRELAAISGTPELQPSELNGSLQSGHQVVDWASNAATVVSASPEYQAAQARVSKARASLTRHGVQSIPNLTVQLAAGVDNATDSGMLNLQFGAPIPVFNKNQGNIAAARGEYCRAVADMQRIEHAIHARVAAISKQYDTSLAAVNTYNDQILPNAQKTLELAEVAYKAGETDFVQVLVARRTYFESNLQNLNAAQNLAQANLMLTGYALSGALSPVVDESGSDELRGLTFSQQ